jgi:hypothetical protein
VVDDGDCAGENKNGGILGFSCVLADGDLEVDRGNRAEQTAYRSLKGGWHVGVWRGESRQSF